MSVALWWWPEANFGDQLSAWLVQRLTGEPVHRAGRADAQLVAAGSVLQHLHASGFSGYIWGTGLISDSYGSPHLPGATYTAVRGHLTREALGLAADLPVGDPGLLLGRFAQRETPQWDVGLVPHRVDRDHPIIDGLASRSGAFTVVDVTAPVDEVIGHVARCRVVVSSALHGLVAADALGIPNAWIELSGEVIGAGFKFRDHLSCFGLQATAHELAADADPDAIVDSLEAYERPGIEDVKRRLLAAFPFPLG